METGSVQGILYHFYESDVHIYICIYILNTIPAPANHWADSVWDEQSCQQSWWHHSCICHAKDVSVPPSLADILDIRIHNIGKISPQHYWWLPGNWRHHWQYIYYVHLLSRLLPFKDNVMGTLQLMTEANACCTYLGLKVCFAHLGKVGKLHTGLPVPECSCIHYVLEPKLTWTLIKY